MLSSVRSTCRERRPTPRRRWDARARRKLAAIVIAGLAVGVGCCIFLWGLSHKVRKLGHNVGSTETPPDEEPFCCLTFLQSLNVDRDRSPCDDFQRYVCPRNASHTSAFRWNTWSEREALLRARHHPEAQSGRLLATLHSQCEALLDHGPKQFAREMSSAILHAAQVPRSTIADQLLLFMAYVSLKLLLKMPIHISIMDSSYPTLRVQVPLAQLASTFSLFNHTCAECVDDVLSMVRDYTGSAARRGDFFAFEASVLEQLDSTVTTCSADLFRAQGARTAWETLSRSIFEATLQDVRMVCVDLPGRISAVFRLFATSDTLSLPLTSIIVHALAQIYLGITANGTANATYNSERRCLLQVHFPNLWIDFYANVTVTAGKSRHVKKLYAQIIAALTTIFPALFPSESQTEVVNQVERLSLYLPPSVLPRDVSPAVTSSNFSTHFLLVKEYEFRLEINRRHRHLPKWLLTGESVYISDPWVVVTPLAYALLDHRNKRKNLMDLPVVGVPIAKGLWSYLFAKKNKWLVAVLKNISSEFLPCLYDVRKNTTELKDMLETALALLTVLSAVRTDGWGKSRNVSSEWQDVTASRIFFLRLGDSLCDGRDSNIGRKLSVVLEQNSVFLDAFKCRDACKMKWARHSNFVYKATSQENLIRA